MAEESHEESRSDANERTLVERAQAGDHDALSSIIATHLEWVYRLARRLEPNPADAEDLVQDTMLKAARAIPRFNPATGSLRQWIGQIAVNTAHARRRQRRSDVPASVIGDVKHAEMMRKVLATLEPPLREVLVLELGGLSASEIGEALGLSRLAVWKKLHRARQHAAHALAELGLVPSVPRAGAPMIAVVWDPKAIEARDYVEIMGLLGDVVRAEGGLGIERLREQTVGVESVAEVPWS